jgi:hypothetical protein
LLYKTAPRKSSIHPSHININAGRKKKRLRHSRNSIWNSIFTFKLVLIKASSMPKWTCSTTSLCSKCYHTHAGSLNFLSVHIDCIYSTLYCAKPQAANSIAEKYKITCNYTKVIPTHNRSWLHHHSIYSLPQTNPLTTRIQCKTS